MVLELERLVMEDDGVLHAKEIAEPVIDDLSFGEVMFDCLSENPERLLFVSFCAFSINRCA